MVAGVLYGKTYEQAVRWGVKNATKFILKTLPHLILAYLEPEFSLPQAPQYFFVC
jgi:hypothetical protein